MESLELKIFLEVARTRSITQAAKRLGYVQSNVTGHIKKMENELQVPLLLRHNKGITLTEDGEKLLQYATKVVGLLEDIAIEFQAHKQTMRIGTTQTIAGGLLPPCLLEYQKACPQAEITVTVREQEELEERLRDGELDCVLTNSTHEFSGAQRIWMARQEIAIGAPLSTRSVKDICKIPVIVNTLKSCPYRNILLNWAAGKMETEQIVELDTVEAMLHMVALGGGITLLPVQMLSREARIRRYDIPDMPTVFISMWIAEDNIPESYEVIKKLLEEYVQ